MTPPTIDCVFLGGTRYRDALELQRRLHALRADGQIGDLLLLTEHEPVVTLGRRGDERHVHATPEELCERGIDLVRTERGGDVTYHGPGQLVAYPIVDLRGLRIGVRHYVHQLEETVIALLQRYGIAGTRRDGTPGVWAGARKTASLGIYVARWTAMHGVAINVATDLRDFEAIDPCGLAGVKMTSVREELGKSEITLDVAMHDYAEAFARTFDLALREGALPQSAAAREPRSMAPAGRESA